MVTSQVCPGGSGAFSAAVMGGVWGKSPFHSSSVLKRFRFFIKNPAKYMLLTDEAVKMQQPAPLDLWRNSCSVLLLQVGFCLYKQTLSVSDGAYPSTHSCGSLQANGCTLPLKTIFIWINLYCGVWGAQNQCCGLVVRGCFNLCKV